MKSLFFSFSILSLQLYANNDAHLRNLENRVSALEQRKNGGGVILPTAGANLDDDVGICIDAELLIWKSHQTGMNFVQGQDPSGYGIYPYGKPSYNFNPGVRVDLGLRPVHDDWQIDAIWTGFYNKAKNTYTSNPASLTALFKTTATLDPASQVSGVWRVNLNMIDLAISRASFFSKWMSVKPYLAVRNVWLHQKYTIHASGHPGHSTGGCAESQMKSYLWAIGPMAGFELKFGMGEGFYLFNNSSGAILWGFFENTQNSSGTASSDYVSGMDIHTSTFNVNMSLGLGWDHKFDDNHYRLSLRGAWEHLVFFNTNYFQSAAINNNTAIDTPNGNYTIEGFTFAVRFDF
jgi:hypothetical protein